MYGVDLQFFLFIEILKLFSETHKI